MLNYSGACTISHLTEALHALRRVLFSAFARRRTTETPDFEVPLCFHTRNRQARYKSSVQDMKSSSISSVTSSKKEKVGRIAKSGSKCHLLGTK